MTFDDILADCIEALEQGATLQECLTRYPAHATALEPYLRLVVSLSAESQTRLSAPAFQRGRQLLSAQAQQRRAHHRQPVYPAVPATRHARPAAYPSNGLPQRRPHSRRPVADKRAWWSLGLPRLLRTALLLMIVLGTTTLFRQVMTSLPGTTFYPVKSTGEQLVGVLMEAAGEGVPWHTAQAERRLQELAQLADPDVTTVQTLAQGVETHWEAMLVASEGLPTAERDALLEAQIARLQQLEATWTTGQADVSPPAVATVRKLITASAAALAGPAPTENQTETVATPTMTATSTAMPSSTLTPTPLLQASATVATVVPVLVPSSTPTASPTLAAPTVEEVLPTVELPSPTEVVSEPPVTTPLPEITVQMPQQESNTQQEDEDHSDNDNSAEAATATPTPSPELPTEVTPLPATTATVADTDGTVTTQPIDATVTAPLTPVATDVQPTPIPTNQTPQVSSTVENTPAVPTKTAPGATSTAGSTVEAQATGTARPTNQATATRTPKPTATHANASTATPDAANTPTAVPATAVENTPAPTSQPTTPPRDEALQTPSSASVTPVLSQPVKPRPTTPSGEPTKGVQP